MASLRSIRHLKQQLERFGVWGIACKTMSATCPSVILLRFLCFCSFFFVLLLYCFILFFTFFFHVFFFLFFSFLFSSLLFLIFRLVLEITPLGTPDAPSQRVSWQRFSGAVAKACALKHRLLLFRVFLTEQGPRPPLGSQFKSHSPQGFPDLPA